MPGDGILFTILLVILSMSMFIFGYSGIPYPMPEVCYTDTIAQYEVRTEDGIDFIYDVKQEKLINLNKYFGLDLEEGQIVLCKRDACNKLWYGYLREYYTIKQRGF